MSMATNALRLQLILMLFGFLLMGCERHEDEQEVLNVVNDGIAMLEEQKVGKSMRLTTGDFLAHPGKMGRMATSRKLMAFFRGKSDIRILHPEPDVEILEAGDAALVSMPFVIARKGAEAEYLAKLEDDPGAWAVAASKYTSVQNVELSLVKQKGRWLIRTVRF